jgi:hypothetical protein
MLSDATRGIAHFIREMIWPIFSDGQLFDRSPQKPKPRVQKSEILLGLPPARSNIFFAMIRMFHCSTEKSYLAIPAPDLKCIE